MKYKELRRKLTMLQSKAYKIHDDITSLIREIDVEQNKKDSEQSKTSNNMSDKEYQDLMKDNEKQMKG